MENAKAAGTKRRRVKRVILIIIIVIVVVAVVLGVKFFAIPAMKISNLEKSLSMEDSVTASAGYTEYMADAETVSGWAEDLVNMGERRPGTEAGEEAQQYVYDKFIEFGLSDVQIVESDSTLYECDDYSLTVEGTDMECYYMGYTGISSEYGDFENDVEAELVYVNYGEESDFNKIDVEGKIVVCDVEFTELPIIGIKLMSYLFYDPDGTMSLLDSKLNPYSSDYLDAYTLAMENGAAGFIGVLTNYIDSCTYNNEDLRYVVDYEADLPALWVSNTTGDAIKEAIDGAEDGASAELTLGGTFSQIEAGAVVGFAYGQSNETLMVESHYDSVTAGGSEDASGCTAMMAIASMYAQIPAEDLERTVMFVAMDTHFTDYDSHDSMIAEYLSEDSEYDILCNLAVEHISLEVEENADGEIEFTGETEQRIIFISEDNDSLLDITQEEFIRHGLTRTIILPATIFGDEVPTDGDMFYQEGVPIIDLISAPIYLYDEIDTFDKVAVDELVPTAECYGDIIYRLMDLDASEFY